MTAPSPQWQCVDALTKRQVAVSAWSYRVRHAGGQQALASARELKFRRIKIFEFEAQDRALQTNWWPVLYD
jgi:hypothetical protein